MDRASGWGPYGVWMNGAGGGFFRLATDSVAEGPLWAGSWPKFDSVMGVPIIAFVLGQRYFQENVASSGIK